jgi:acyl-CoA synthetase (AMP-forming)/AMP-acid ligase II
MDPSWNLILAVLAGVPLVVLPRFSASTFWSDVGRSGATFFYCLGTMPLYLLKRPEDPAADRGHRIRIAYCSGIPAARHAEMERRWGCIWRETYGTTELGVVLAATPDDDASVGSGSMGRPVAGREVAIGTAATSKQTTGGPGELLVRGPDTMLRYHDDPEATEAWSADGWMHTGDIVRASGSGYSLVGRTKDMIRRAGENISAAEVESVLAEHPDVQAAACIPVPDDLRGEEVKAYVLPREGAAPLEADLHAWVTGRLARFKAPRYIELVPSLPLTQSEKIAKAELAASRTDHVAGAWDATRASGAPTPSSRRA